MRSLFITLAFSLVALVATASPKILVDKDGTTYTIHKISKGETLYSLAKQYGVTVEELIAVNEELTENIKVGQKIKVPVKELPTEEVKPEVAAEPQSVAEVAVQEKKDSLTTLTDRALSLLEQFMSSNPELLSVEPVQLKFRKLQQGERAKVVLMLPLGSEAEPATRYVDFYRGFLMGLDSVRMSGRSVDLHVYNTARDTVRIAEIIASGELEKADLVIGPVYDEELKPVLSALECKGVPVVSPLSTHTDIKSNVLFQMSPSYGARFDKMHDLFDGSRRVILISTPNVDVKFDTTVRELLKRDSLTVIEKSYYNTPGQTIGKGYAELLALLREGPAVVVVTSNNEFEVEKILTSLNSMRQTIAARTGTSEPFVVVGNSSWTRFHGIENTVFYKNRIRIMSSYNSDRTDKINRTFERRFIRTYNTMPSLFAFRGYDAAVLFVKALYSGDLENYMEGVRFEPLSTPYLFKKDEGMGVRANSEWIKQIYNRDNTITYE